MSGSSQAAAPFALGGRTVEPDREIMTSGEILAADYYTQARFDREVEVFKRTWMNVIRVDDLPDPGDWIVRDLKFASVSVLFTHGKDGTIRAFYNVCGHRSMKLVWGESGHGSRFTCPYHAWLYSADGSLLNVPDGEAFDTFDRRDCALRAIACETWEGFVFINLDPQGSLAEFLGPLADKLRNVPFGLYKNKVRVTTSINANWKLAMEAQLESYHARMLHSKTVSSMLAYDENPYVHPITWETFGAHRLHVTPRNPGYRPDMSKPVQAFTLMNTAHMVVQTADSGGFGEHINHTQSDIWGSDQYSVFPNIVFHLALNGWWVHRYYPVAPGKCIWEYVGYYNEASSLREQFALESTLAFNRDTLMEDNFAVEEQQVSIESGAYTTLRFGKVEMLLRHAAAVMEAVIDRPVPASLAAE